MIIHDIVININSILRILFALYHFLWIREKAPHYLLLSPAHPVNLEILVTLEIPAAPMVQDLLLEYRHQYYKTDVRKHHVIPESYSVNLMT